MIDLVNVLFATGGGLLGWFLRIAQIRELKSKATLNISGVLESVQRKDLEYHQACKKCSNIARNIDSAIQGKAPLQEIRDLREELCDAFLDDVVIHLHQYLDSDSLTRSKWSKAQRDILQVILVSEIDIFSKWIVRINHPNMLKNLKVSPLKVGNAWTQRFLNHANKVDWIHRFKVKKKLEESLSKLTAASKTE